MKSLFLFISTFFFTVTVLSQDTTKSITYNQIVLNDSVNEAKVLAFTFRQAAVFYFRESAIKRLAEEHKFFSTSKALDSSFSKSDTLTFDLLSYSKSSFYLETYILLSSELSKGNVKIWLRKEGMLVENIYYFLNDLKFTTEIIYCLPDKIPFYMGLSSFHSGGLHGLKRKRRKH